MKEISETGYWNGETAHIHHVHSKELSNWICNFLKEDKAKITYDFGCFTANSKIKTPKGEIKISDLKIGDTVYDIYFNEVIINKVFKKIANNRVNISTNIGKNLEYLETTLEHPILGIKRKDLQTLKYKNPLRASLKQEHESDLYEKPYFLKAEDLQIGDLIAIPRQIGIIKEHTLSKLLGFYLAEGSILYSHKPHIGGVLLTFNINETEYGEEAKKLALELGATSVTLKPIPEKSILEVFIYGKAIGEKLLELGNKLSHEKKLSNQIKNWDNESKLNILRYWLKGDGHKNKKETDCKKLQKNWSGKTVSLQLAKDLLSIARDIGLNPTMNVEMREKYNHKNAYKLLFNNLNYDIIENINIKRKRVVRSWRKSNNFIYVTIKNIEIIKEKEEVFNLNVSGDHTYICENYAVHNCGLGNYLKDLQESGFLNLIGYEADPSKKKVFKNIMVKDLTIPFVLPIGGNVISLEVGEHIPKKYQDIYLDNITKNCNGYLITSWAIRGQAGFGHVNCLDNHEIIPEIEKRGFKYLEKDSMLARSVIKDNAAWFRNTILIFKKD